MIFAKRCAAIALATCAGTIAIAHLSATSKFDSVEAAPASFPAFAPDKGSFRILVNGQQIGKEEFEIKPDGGSWIARGSSELQTADGATRVSGTLDFRADGNPTRYEWSTEGKKKASATIDFTSLTATIQLQLDGAKPYTQQFTFDSAPITVLDNNLYHQYAILARLYDREKKGPQKFSVLVPQSLTPGTIIVDSQGTKDLNGKKVEELTAKTEVLELKLDLDNGRLIRVAAPDANAEIVRD